MYFLGFDPGGRKQFGWCVTELMETGGLKLVDSGTADDSRNAVSFATRNIPDGDQIIGARIDSPLYWLSEGSRRADTLIRSEMKHSGAKHVWGAYFIWRLFRSEKKALAAAPPGFR
jgi:hypothetical protein